MDVDPHENYELFAIHIFYSENIQTLIYKSFRCSEGGIKIMSWKSKKCPQMSRQKNDLMHWGQ